MKRIFKWSLPILLVPFLFSCATYNNSMNGYYEYVRNHDYAKAVHSIEHNKLIKKNRNALLYNLEMGRLYFLQNDFTHSNIYLNRADNLMQTPSKSFSDLALGNLLNPMHEAYRGEDFEQFMMHFYKALNYSALGQKDEAVVEARRITLSENIQGDKFKNKDYRYSKDAFALNLQGMIYEMAGDLNNAFISYRNAAEAYKGSKYEYYGVSMPQQLRNDLIRTAAAMGFSEEKGRFEKMYNVSNKEGLAAGGELILFLEEGYAPVKEEKNFLLTAGKNGISSFLCTDGNGYSTDFDFNYTDFGIDEDKLRDIRTFRVAIPEYRIQYPNSGKISITANGTGYLSELVHDLNNAAVNILKERFITEMANALARQITKKLVEKGTQAAAKEIAKESENKEDKNAVDAEEEKQKMKKKQHAKEAGEVTGFLMNMVNTATEKADTRNWQSLPAFVSYVRIPLKPGENTVSVSVNGQTTSLKVNGNRGLQMKAVTLN